MCATRQLAHRYQPNFCSWAYSYFRFRLSLSTFLFLKQTEFKEESIEEYARDPHIRFVLLFKLLFLIRFKFICSKFICMKFMRVKFLCIKFICT